MTVFLLTIAVLITIIAGKWVLLFLVASIAEALSGGENGDEGDESAW